MPKNFACAVREHDSIKKKFHTDWVWIIWDTILLNIQKDYAYIDRNKQILSLYKLFCWDYKKSGKNTRLYLLRLAILYMIPNIPPIKYNISVCQYPKIIIKNCLIVNNIYFKIIKASKKYFFVDKSRFTLIETNTTFIKEEDEIIETKTKPLVLESDVIKNKKKYDKNQRIKDLESKMKDYDREKPIIPF